MSITSAGRRYSLACRRGRHGACGGWCLDSADSKNQYHTMKCRCRCHDSRGRRANKIRARADKLADECKKIMEACS